MKKRDVIFGITVIILGIILFGITRFCNNSAGNYVEIVIDGKLYGVYAIDKDQDIKIDNKYGCNTVCIKDGEAYMKQADCPDGYCKNQGKISRKNQSIVCLPHKLVVQIVEKGNSGKTSGSTKDGNSDDTDDNVPDVVAK